MQVQPSVANRLWEQQSDAIHPAQVEGPVPGLHGDLPLGKRQQLGDPHRFLVHLE